MGPSGKCVSGFRRTSPWLRSSKSGKSGAGERDIPVSVGGVTINAGDLVTSDDGIVVRPS